MTDKMRKRQFSAAPDVLEDVQEILVGLLPEDLAQHDLMQPAAPPCRRLECKASVEKLSIDAPVPL